MGGARTVSKGRLPALEFAALCVTLLERWLCTMIVKAA